jgi:hypothetical protein
VDTDLPPAKIRLERSGTFGLVAKFGVVIDGVSVGQSARRIPSEFPVSPGKHRVYVSAPRPSREKSNVIEVDLASGEAMELVCHASFPIHKGLLRALTMGAWKPQVLFLAEKQPILS